MLVAYWKKWSWDGLGLSIAGLCLVHCLATSVFLVVLASAGGVLVDPAIHEAIGALGIGIMAGALTLPHGGTEIIYTILGVGILALGHDLNHRATH
jgi:hypothetical protein